MGEKRTLVPRAAPVRESRYEIPREIREVRRDERRPSSRSRKRDRSRRTEKAPEPPRKSAKISSDQLTLIAKFIKRNKLNQSAEETLKVLNQSDQNTIIAHFDPDEGGNVNDNFFNLIRSKCPYAKIMSARR